MRRCPSTPRQGYPVKRRLLSLLWLVSHPCPRCLVLQLSSKCLPHAVWFTLSYLSCLSALPLLLVPLSIHLSPLTTVCLPIFLVEGWNTLSSWPSSTPPITPHPTPYQPSFPPPHSTSAELLYVCIIPGTIWRADTHPEPKSSPQCSRLQLKPVTKASCAKQWCCDPYSEPQR